MKSVEVIIPVRHIDPAEGLFRAKPPSDCRSWWLSGKPVNSVPGRTEEEQFAEWIGEISAVIAAAGEERP